MISLNKKFFSKNSILNLLVLCIPISYVAGNLIINLNIVLLIIATLALFSKDFFKLKINKLDKIIFLLFLYILINGFYNNFYNLNLIELPKNYLLIKSVLYLKYLLFYISIRCLLSKEIINFKILFLSISLSALFVNIDIFVQYFFGKDFFGYEATSRRLSGPFGEEYIAGSFLQRFSFFLISYLVIFYNFKKKIYFDISVLFFISILTIGIILSGNRVPLLLFLIMLGLSIIFQKELRRTFLIYTSIIFIALICLVNFSKDYKIHYMGFVNKSIQISFYLKEKILGSNMDLRKIALHNLHIKELETGFQTYKLNPIVGGGLRSFYLNCANIEPNVLKELNKIGGCNSHPHNYYLQIAAELGLLGLILISSIFLFLTVKILKLLFNSNFNTFRKNLMIPFFLLFLAEIFPLKSTGNFFTTANSTFLFFIIAFLISLSEYKNPENAQRK